MTSLTDVMDNVDLSKVDQQRCRRVLEL